MNRWLRIVIKTPLPALEAIYYFLWQQARGISLDKEEDGFILSAYIEHSSSLLKRLERFVHRLKRQYSIEDIPILFDYSEDRHIPFVITPSHFNLPGIPIIIEPGTSFGTGGHPTTVYCLKLLYKLYKDFPPFPKTVLDAGTGTGILAIAASRLGARKVVAIDISPDAVNNARRNIALNHLKNIDVISCCITKVKGRFDLILANLYDPVLRVIYEKLIELLNSSGWLIVSGISRANYKEIIPYFTKNGLKIIKDYSDEKWYAAILKFIQYNSPFPDG